MQETKEFEKIQSDYVPISTTTGSIYVSKGKVCLTIQTSQPERSAPIMAILHSGVDRPIKVKSGSTLYVKSANLNKASITFTEA